MDHMKWNVGDILELGGPTAIEMLECRNGWAKVSFKPDPINFDVLARRHPELKNSGFAHVLTVRELVDVEAYEIASGLTIRKASTSEEATLHDFHEMYPPDRHPFGAPGRNPYETHVRKHGKSGRSSCQLPRSRWRYHVISFEDLAAEHLPTVSIMTKSRLQLGLNITQRDDMTLNKPTPGMTGNASRECWQEMRMDDSSLLQLTVSDLEDLSHVYRHVDLIRPGAKQSELLAHALKNFQHLDGIPRRSPLRFLGLMATLESLITHAPSPKDPYDSLTRQVKKKMELIGNRAVLPIPYDMFDPNVKRETIWGAIYMYRSQIAHGQKVDFSNKLSCLKDRDTAFKFVEWAVRSVIRQTAEEPALMADLHQC